MTETTTTTTSTYETPELTQAKAIAFALTLAHDPAFIAEQPDGNPNPRLLRADGNGPDLYLVTDNYGGRIRVSILWPREGKHGPVYTPSTREMSEATTQISVSAHKSAEQIARDITRRLLPDATRLWRQERDRVLRHQDHEQTTKTNLERIASETGGKVRQGGLWWPHTSDRPYVWSVQVSGTSVNLDFRGLSVDQAIAMIRLMQETKQ